MKIVVYNFNCILSTMLLNASRKKKVKRSTSSCLTFLVAVKPFQFVLFSNENETHITVKIYATWNQISAAFFLSVCLSLVSLSLYLYLSLFHILVLYSIFTNLSLTLTSFFLIKFNSKSVSHTQSLQMIQKQQIEWNWSF